MSDASGPRNILLDAERIRGLLQELADKLDALRLAHPITVVIAGGSCLALMGLRESTIDVDAVSPIPESLASAVVEVAHEQGLQDTWLNARAAAWRPRTLDERTCTRLLVSDSLVVLGVSADALLLMKLNRANETDQADIRRVWPLCTFETAEQVVTSYYEAFPAEACDPHLVDFVESLIGTVE